MQIELSELSLKYSSLRVLDERRVAELATSLLRFGQQTAVLVTGTAPESMVLLDGYHRVAALRSIAHDVANAMALPVDERDGLLLVHGLEHRRSVSALEEGWLISELVDAHGMSQSEIASRLGRSRSWVCRRLALVSSLPSSAQDAVRTGIVPPQGAMKFLAPLSRDNSEHCEQLVSALGKTRVSVRQLEELYRGWRFGDDEQRARIAKDPLLFLKVNDAVRAPDVARPEDASFEASLIAKDLGVIIGLCSRANRRLDKGVLQGARGRQRTRLYSTYGQARAAFGALSVHFDDDKEPDARPRHTDGDPAAASGGPRRTDDSQGALGLEERGEGSAA